jgi:hypothetical protein
MSDAERDIDRIKLLLDVYGQDSTQVMVLVSLCFALPAFTLSQVKLDGLSTIAKVFLLISLLLFIMSGLLFFRYAQYQNWKRLEGVDSILRMDPVELKDVLMGPRRGLWAIAWRFYTRGTLILTFAAGSYALFFVMYLFPRLFVSQK